ncbi:MAG TPA: hypothetical protein VJU58_13675 [Microbacterium sp.]|nr:hypothetical protein [Microbacterium sp.]
MICEGCGIDKTVTVLYGVTLIRFVGPTARETTEHRKRRLCVACGGGESLDEQREMALDQTMNRRRNA